MALALTLGACAGELRDYSIGGPSSGIGLPIGGGNRGTGGGSTVPAALVGTWQIILVIDLGFDVQTWTTVWRFDADQSCRFLQTSVSALEGFPRTDDRRCTFKVVGQTLEVTFDAGGGRLSLPFTFRGGSPDRLVLEGLEYRRIG